MAIERFNHCPGTEIRPTVVGLASVDHPAHAELVDPVTPKDLLLVAGIFAGNKTTLQLNNLPVVDRSLNAQLDDELDPLIDWQRGKRNTQQRAVGVTEDLGAQRADALIRVVGSISTNEMVVLPGGEAVQKLLAHLIEYIEVEGNLAKLVSLIGDSQKAAVLLHKSHGVQEVRVRNLSHVRAPQSQSSNCNYSAQKFDA